MNKKIIAMAAAGTMLALAAGPAFGHRRSDDVRVTNRTSVSNNTVTVANTGVARGARTGNARAYADILNKVNYTEVGCGCTDGDVVVNNGATVRNNTVTVANTGFARGHHHGRRGHRGSTGNALANSVVTNHVNTTIVGGF